MNKTDKVSTLQAFMVLHRTCPGANNANVMGVIKKEVQILWGPRECDLGWGQEGSRGSNIEAGIRVNEC